MDINTILISALTGLGGLFVWYVKYKVPKDETRKDAKFQAQLKEQRTRLEAEIENKKDRREHSQATENAAIEVLREIIRESIQEYSKEAQESRESIHRLGRQIDNITQSVRALAGIIESQRSEEN